MIVSIPYQIAQHAIADDAASVTDNADIMKKRCIK